MNILEYLDTNYLIIIPALWVLGYGLKRTPKIPDWSIIWILSTISLLITFFSFGVSLDSFINGIVVAGISVYGHQIFKQTSSIRKRK